MKNLPPDQLIKVELPNILPVVSKLSTILGCTAIYLAVFFRYLHTSIDPKLFEPCHVKQRY